MTLNRPDRTSQPRPPLPERRQARTRPLRLATEMFFLITAVLVGAQVAGGENGGGLETTGGSLWRPPEAGRRDGMRASAAPSPPPADGMAAGPAGGPEAAGGADPAKPDPDWAADVVEKARKGVVRIVAAEHTGRRVETLWNEAIRVFPLRTFFTDHAKLWGYLGRKIIHPRTFRYQGSGFVVSADGYVATSFHVVEMSARISVMLHDDTELEAHLTAFDEDYDLAILKVESPVPLEPLPLGRSAVLRPGQAAVAVGHPFGGDLTATVGIIGGTGRSADLGAYDHFVQMDAVLNPGNSGGPLLDSRGRVIGVNCAAFRVFREANFAVPVDFLTVHLGDMKAGRSPVRTWIGVEIAGLTRERAAKRKAVLEKGLYVEVVMRGSPAEKAGIRRGDVILTLDEEPVRRPGELVFELQKRRPGETVRLGAVRKGADGKAEAVRFDVALAARPKRHRIF
ncbi:MAG: trypsin-like peptidase domain-containing protein [Planctomycetota bacterium]|nr:trypsin-like peptidase domain-containing protein [Planctomycetota bacterium]